MEGPGSSKGPKVPKVAKVKNKTPAEIQITAEQLLREAKERDLEIVPPPPKQKISDPDELADYRLRKRKAFEDNIRKNRSVVTNWIKYAQWEESQKEIDRARSVFERALDVDHRNVSLWLKYAEMEMKNRQVNHARNIWDRAVSILPRVNQFWYKYTYMEEMLGNVAGTRQVFERWMEWEPEEQAWLTYIKFELRYKEIDRARQIYEKFVYVHPDVKNWIRFARFEEQNSFISNARGVYERAVEFYGEEYMDEKLFIAFARFEENQREHDRVRVIYKYALDHLPKDKTEEVYKNYTIHEKKYGDRAGIEDVIVSKRKHQYEERVQENPLDYDTWFDYLRLLESEETSLEATRELYERAIANVPLAKEKRLWRRYIYLWINYALFEELTANDAERTRAVYKACLELIPHKIFTFAKIWIMAAHFEVRQKDLTAARKILGVAIGKCPKDKLFREYIDLEIQVREFDRCRKLYEKFLEFSPENCTTWMRFAELESILGDAERARAIYELAVAQPRLDMPEVVWKAYIDFEIEHEEFKRADELYERLLERTQHVKVWISLAHFRFNYGANLLPGAGGAEGESPTMAREVFERGNRELRGAEKEERIMLLEAWQEFEAAHGDESSRSAVAKQMPKKVKKRRKITADDGTDAGWEEYYDYIFAADEESNPHLRLLEMAKLWKQKQKVQEDDDDEEQEDEQNEQQQQHEPSGDHQDGDHQGDRNSMLTGSNDDDDNHQDSDQDNNEVHQGSGGDHQDNSGDHQDNKDTSNKDAQESSSSSSSPSSSSSSSSSEDEAS